MHLYEIGLNICEMHQRELFGSFVWLVRSSMTIEPDAPSMNKYGFVHSKISSQIETKAITSITICSISGLKALNVLHRLVIESARVNWFIRSFKNYWPYQTTS